MWPNLKHGWLVLAVLLSLFLLFSLVSLPGEAVYQVTESELTELETILTTQAEIIKQQETSLSEQASLIQTLQTTIDEQESLINEVKISFEQYAKEARRKVAIPWLVVVIEGLIIGIGTYLIITK